MSLPLVVGNWKMNTLVWQARELARGIRQHIELHHFDRSVRIVLCPPFVNLTAVAEELAGSSIDVGAQNCWTEPYGAFTGEISAAMLRAIGCRYVLIGHSERRTLFHENDAMIAEKLLRAWEAELVPILCIGETLQQRQLNQTWNVVENQLRGILSCQERSKKWVCAYEPVWAIGTGIAAEAEQIKEVHEFIRLLLNGRGCSHVPILYGGSITPENASVIFSVQNVSGGLVGGASLRVESFVAIIEAAAHAYRTRS
ncbi:MAG: triose-phosphate isomerase [Chlorobi bacterium]|nr:triose-phosphate isomerase [Chlorobiota bacterium]